MPCRRAPRKWKTCRHRWSLDRPKVSVPIRS
jgi:hypothetical protein